MADFSGNSFSEIGLFSVCVCNIISCLTLCDPVDCSLPGSSVHGILQARILEWVAISFSKGSSRPRDQTAVSCIAGRRFTLWATREGLLLLYYFNIISVSVVKITSLWKRFNVCFKISPILHMLFQVFTILSNVTSRMIRVSKNDSWFLILQVNFEIKKQLKVIRMQPLLRYVMVMHIFHHLNQRTCQAKIQAYSLTVFHLHGWITLLMDHHSCRHVSIVWTTVEGSLMFTENLLPLLQ